MEWTAVILNIWRVLELWCMPLAFILPLRKKEKRWKLHFAAYAGVGAIVFWVFSFAVEPLLFAASARSILFLVLAAILFWRCADLSGKAVVYCAVWSTMLSDFLIECNTLICRRMSLRPERAVGIGAVLLMALVIGVGCTIARWMPDKGSYHTGPRQFTFALILWIVSLLSNAFGTAWNPDIQDMSAWLLLLLIEFYCITVLYLQHGLFQKSAIRQELTLLHTLWLKQKAQYDLSKENIALINRKCHDLKHQIRALRMILLEGQQEKYLHEVEQSVRIYDVLAKTGNEVLDTVLTEKSLFCEANGIQANCVADGRLLSFMDPVDLYTVFGNALDNAIESVSAIEDRTCRIIDVQIYSEKQMVVIQIINPVGTELAFDGEGLPITTKEPDGYHGFGLRSIRHTVEKYGGFMTVQVEDGSFYLRLLLPKEVPHSGKEL